MQAIATSPACSDKQAHLAHRLHVDLQQQQIAVGLGRAELGGPFRRLPIGHARIVEAGVFRLSRAAIRPMMRQRYGRIASDVNFRSGEHAVLGRNDHVAAAR